MMTGGYLADVPCLLVLSISEPLEIFLLAVCTYPGDSVTNFPAIQF